MPTGRVGPDCAFDPFKDEIMLAAQKAGMVNIEPDGPGFWHIEHVGVIPLKPDPNKEPSQGCDKYSSREDLATKTLVNINGVRALSATTAEVEFTWKWGLTPRGKKLLGNLSPTEIQNLEPYFIYPASSYEDLQNGLADLEQNAKVHTAKRTLTKSGQGWRVVVDRETATDIMGAHLKKRESIMPEIGRVGSHCTILVKQTEVELDDNPETSIGSVVAKKAGYISIAADGKDYWRVALTASGQAALHHTDIRALYDHEGVKGCDYQVASLPVARQSLVRIETATDDENSPTVIYLWKWIPTDLGSALTKNGAIYSALTPAQQDNLRHYFSISESPLPLPVPSEGDDSVIRSMVKLKKEVDGTWY
jgi:hypothetical protein